MQLSTVLESDFHTWHQGMGRPWYFFNKTYMKKIKFGGKEIIKVPAIELAVGKHFFKNNEGDYMSLVVTDKGNMTKLMLIHHDMTVSIRIPWHYDINKIILKILAMEKCSEQEFNDIKASIVEAINQ